MKFFILLLAVVPLCYSANLTISSNSSSSNDSGLTFEQKKLLVKAHAILMIIGWLFLVPTGFLFARLGRDLYKGKKLFGSPVWFKVHQASNFVAVGCICISMLCIFVAQNFRWKGIGSSAKYWTQWHTDLGTISTVLAVAQPINSYFRCGPTDAKRTYFNWAHRIIGIVGYFLAYATIIIAAAIFKKTWNEPLLVIVLVSIPTVFSTVLSAAFIILENRTTRSKSDFGADDSLLSNKFPQQKDPLQPHILRVPAIFLSVGAFLASAVALSLLVVNGFKSS